MMKPKFLSAVGLCLLTAVACLGADVSGKWTGQVPGRDGQAREWTFDLKAAGDKLTGTVSSGQLNSTITDGKVSGDTVSFVVTLERGGNTIKQTYTGTVAGDEIKFKREGGQGPAREFTAKRAK